MWRSKHLDRTLIQFYVLSQNGRVSVPSLTIYEEILLPKLGLYRSCSRSLCWLLDIFYHSLNYISCLLCSSACTQSRQEKVAKLFLWSSVTQWDLRKTLTLVWTLRTWSASARVISRIATRCLIIGFLTPYIPLLFGEWHIFYFPSVQHMWVYPRRFSRLQKAHDSEWQDSLFGLCGRYLQGLSAHPKNAGQVRRHPEKDHPDGLAVE